MTEPRRFPPPWTAGETDACFIVKDHNGQAIAYHLFRRRTRPGAQRPACSRATRRGGSRPTSPSCPSCCSGAKRGEANIEVAADQADDPAADESVAAAAGYRSGACIVREPVARLNQGQPSIALAWSSRNCFALSGQCVRVAYQDACLGPQVREVRFSRLGFL
jgi:hypothetical protein